MSFKCSDALKEVQVAHQSRLTTTMSASTSTEETAVSTVIKPLTTLKPIKKLKPARKQVKPGDVEKKETPQTGKEYSACRKVDCIVT